MSKTDLNLVDVSVLPFQLDSRLGEIYLNAKQTAIRLDTTPECLAVWRCQNRFPTLQWIKRGRRVLYRLSDVNRFLDSCAYGNVKETAV